MVPGDESPSDIDIRLEDFHNSLFYEPIPVPDAVEPGVLTAGRSRRKSRLVLTLKVSQDSFDSLSYHILGNANNMAKGRQRIC